MPVSSEEAAQRIRAAREIQGMTQAELGRRLEECGLGKTDAGRIERGQVKLLLIHRAALTKVLGVPDAWFTLDRDELLDRLGSLVATEQVLEERLAALESQITRLAAERPAPAPPGELGRRAEGSRPNGVDRRQSGSSPEEGQSQGGEG